MAKRRKEPRTRVNMTVNPRNYEEFKKVASRLGVSASALLDMVMYFVIKYADKIEEMLYIRQDFLKDVVNDLLDKYGDSLKRKKEK